MDKNIIEKIEDPPLSPLNSFVARLYRLEMRQQKLDFKAFGPFYDDRWTVPVDARHILISQGILMSIKENIKMIQDSRAKCLKCGNLNLFEADYNRLEKAYYNLKVDIESSVRLHQLGEDCNS